MALSKEDKVKKKKGIIIDALKRCLQRDVYSRVTVQDIADEAGFSKGGVLHYYSTKEDIYLELIKDIFTGLEKAQKDLIESEEESKVMAPLSALLGVESFIMDKANVRIIVNLVLYAFEEEKKVAPERMVAIGYGEFRPKYRNDTPDGRMRNRRVEIVLINPEGELKYEERSEFKIYQK